MVSQLQLLPVPPNRRVLPVIWRHFRRGLTRMARSIGYRKTCQMTTIAPTNQHQ